MDSRKRSSTYPVVMSMNTLEAIGIERARQVRKYGPRSMSGTELTSLERLAVLVEEVGEVARGVMDEKPGLWDELVQVAACAISWLELHEELT